MLTGNHKLYFFVSKLKQTWEISSSNKPIQLNRLTNLDGRLTQADIKTLLDRLESDDKIIKSYKQHEENYFIEIAGNFRSYLIRLKSDPDYQKFAGDKLEDIQIIDPIYQVKYSEKTREILINNFLLAKPDFDSENERVFDFLFANPGTKFSVNDIEKHLGEPLGKSLHKIVENLGFTKELKAAFFSVSATSIQFRNPVTKADLEKAGLRYFRLQIQPRKA